MKLSIVVPCRNGARYITRLMVSLAKQTCSDFETIFVDDASTDGSGIIAERLGADLKHFHLVTNHSSRGCGGARNAGMDIATGEYRWFVDVDDWIAEDAVERLLAEIERSKADVILFPYSVVRQTGSARMKPAVKRIEDIGKTPVGPWTHACRRDLAVPFPERIMSEDTAWHFEQFDRFRTVSTMDGEPMYFYDRTNATAITDTVEWCGQHSYTWEQLAFENALVKAGKNDQWISDMVRNFANMYDVRHRLKTPWMRKAWAARFRYEMVNLATGHFSH